MPRLSGRENRTHIYGPVPSRRLGLSLGLDLIPLKSCTFNCIYCQLGCTQSPTVTRTEFVRPAALMDELQRFLDANPEPRPDYVTLAGSGEPTLQLHLDRIIDGARAAAGIPVALITNGSLFRDEAVRRECCAADLILPSLDAADPQTFRRINRPHESLDFDSYLAGLVSLRAEFSGPIWLEIMIVGGQNDDAESLAKLKAAVGRIAPDRIQLNTVVRVPAERRARAVGAERMNGIREFFGERAEVIADYDRAARGGKSEKRKWDDRILALLSRRSCTVGDIASGLDLPPNEAIKEIEALQKAGLVRAESWSGRVLYFATGAGRDEG